MCGVWSARLLRLVVYLMLEGVIKEYHLALDPPARLPAHGDLTVALRHDEAEVGSQPRVGRAAVGGEARVRPEQREVCGAHLPVT